jgi:uncharacterized membrane protein
MSKARVEGFSDGVFAIAITLLVFSIAQPSDFHDLRADLVARWPSFAAYTVSFAVIGTMWLNHHSVFSHFDHADRGLIHINLLLLFTVAFLPYPTGILGTALAQNQGTRVAAVLYSGTMVANSLAWAALWLWGSSRRRLLVTSFPEAERRMATLLFSAGTFCYAVTIAVAFLSPIASLACQGAFGAYYTLDPLGRRIGRRSKAQDQG